ncbi:MAG: ornithine carbamoyltransferase [Planctomycetes bacterium]|nr:ornithine carbamoyltransferase [Planctomycetota bacterium]
MPHKDLVTVAQLAPAEIVRIFAAAAELKRNRREHCDVLRGKKLAMIFEKDSLRTRFTFDVGMQDLGGGAVFMDHRDARIGSRESVKDVARNLERWVDAIVARTFKHRVVTELADNCSIPVINGLSDYLHPCQALSDTFTLWEKWDGRLAGRKMAYIGDGNNTCHSLVHAAAKLGMEITVCTPEGYEPNAKVVSSALHTAHETGGDVHVVDDPEAAVAGAEAIYTDTWASMGQEDEAEERAAIFHEYQVNEDLMEKAAPGAYFMHCLPAHRGAEVTTGVMDGPQSIVYDIAENRLHVQKAILVLLMNR